MSITTEKCWNHEIFISYAQVDNEPLIAGDEDSRWVSTMRKNLQIMLDEKLGRKGSARIWFDLSHLSGNQVVTPELRARVEGTKTLVVIMSDGYLASEWCRDERRIFLEAAEASGGAAGRIFVVHRDEIERGLWPTEFRDLVGYPFYEKNPDNGMTRTLGTPKPDPYEREYFGRLNRLRTDLAIKLKEIGEKPPIQMAETARAEGTTAPSSAVATVFLAEVTPDFFQAREDMESYLRQEGFEVKPTSFYSRAPEEYQAALDADLEDAAVFVQLFGQYASARMPTLPGGYEGLQMERALVAKLPMLQWRAPDLDPQTISVEDHRNMVEGSEVMAMDLEEFKSHVTEVIRKQVAQCGRSEGSEVSEKYVLVNTSKSDLATADQISAILADQNIGFDVIDDDEISLADLADGDDYDALMVVYGQCPEQWVRRRVRECRQVALKKKTKAPMCAVYIGAPDEKEPLRTRPPRFHIIDHGEEGDFRQFMEELIRTA
jgi:hypothetical protein